MSLGPHCLLRTIYPNTYYYYGSFSKAILIVTFTSLPTNGDFYHLLIIFANSLDPDQARQNVGPDLDPNCLTL